MAQVDMPKSSIGQGTAEPKKKFEKVVKGKVTVKEQSDIQKLAGDFLAEDLKTVKDRLLVDYILPMLKNGVWSIVNSAISIALWGEDRSRGGTTNYSGPRTQRNSYDGYWQGSQSRQYNPGQTPRLNLQNLDFESRGDADDTLSQMRDSIRSYDQVSVGDLWDMMGITPSNTEYNYGWHNLDGAYIKGIPGGYRLVLPRPVPLR